MFGCHNCGKRPQKGESYEKTACAGCRAMRNPRLLSYYPKDRDFFQIQVVDPFDERSEDAEYPPALEQKENILSVLSQALQILIRMKEQNPVTYRVVEAKMSQPMLSYSQLAEKLCCRKQNISYHLRKALQICPELGCALIIDTRRLGSRESVVSRAAARR